MANYPQGLAQDAVCQSHTGHMTGLWFLLARPLRLNTNELICPLQYLSDFDGKESGSAIYFKLLPYQFGAR